MSSPATGSGRRAAREQAVMLCYEREQRSMGAADLLVEQILDPDTYTVDVVSGVEADQPEIDATIVEFADGWALDRMPALDRAILRVGIFELGHRDDIPTAVVINEAVELANTYSTDDSGRFVNGVLSAVATEVRGEG